MQCTKVEMVLGMVFCLLQMVVSLGGCAYLSSANTCDCIVSCLNYHVHVEENVCGRKDSQIGGFLHKFSTRKSRVITIKHVQKTSIILCAKYQIHTNHHWKCYTINNSAIYAIVNTMVPRRRSTMKHKYRLVMQGNRLEEAGSCLTGLLDCV